MRKFNEIRWKSVASIGYLDEPLLSSKDSIESYIEHVETHAIRSKDSYGIFN